MQVKSNLQFWIDKAFELFDEAPWLSWTEVLQTLADSYETNQVWQKDTMKKIIEQVNDMRE